MRARGDPTQPSTRNRASAASRGRLGEGAGLAERAIDLVGRNMDEAECILAGAGQFLEVGEAGSSSTWVPTTLVATNCAGLSIERSTWNSAAR